MEMFDIERAVVEKILIGDHPVLSALRLDFQTVRVTERELTGAGFYTSFRVDAQPIRNTKMNLIFGDVVARRVNGLQYGADFVLYVKDGYLNMLEGSTYGESWPDKVSDFALGYRNAEGDGGVSDERDWVALKKILEPYWTNG